MLQATSFLQVTSLLLTFVRFHIFIEQHSFPSLQTTQKQRTMEEWGGVSFGGHVEFLWH